MPISSALVDGIIVTTVEGESDLASVQSHLAATRVDRARQQGVPVLVDCRRVKTLLSSSELRAIARQSIDGSEAAVQRRVAMLAASDVVYGLMRIYEALTAGTNLEVRVFRAEAEAWHWLRTGAEPP
jgi:hypothetical protein